MREGGNQLGLSSNETGSFQMSKTSQKQGKGGCLPCHGTQAAKPGASQHQGGTAGGNPWQGAAASPGKRALGFLGSERRSPALPCIPRPSPCPRRSSPSAETGHGMGRDFPTKKSAVTREVDINSCRLRTVPRACLKTKQWGTTGNQSPNCSVGPSQPLHKMV